SLSGISGVALACHSCAAAGADKAAERRAESTNAVASTLACQAGLSAIVELFDAVFHHAAFVGSLGQRGEPEGSGSPSQHDDRKVSRHCESVDHGVKVSVRPNLYHRDIAIRLILD